MSELSPLIIDLALILMCAGLTTLIFKRLKQPLVLGYIVAGFIASPHMPYTPSVQDTNDIKLWADIGVIFLLFALGLEFSFKKLMKVGGTAIIAACSVILVMIVLGVLVGMSFGWDRMDCIYLGGMLAMSSTTIIYKAFDDMGLRQQRFAGLVLSVLILEDILAIVLMVMLSTLAVSQNFEGMEMVQSVVKLVFFLVLWFVVGIYIIPTFLKRVRKWMSAETLLVVAVGMCFLMVVLAAEAGFSAAFGAFMMGSILAETVEAESIEKLVAPVKDLFGAIFFVSVGMMVDPAMIVEYKIPIIVITLTILLGQSILGSGSFVLAGQPLKVAMQCGFSLTQIGEFAFIIASLGVSLNVTSDFLYPIVVAVSVITTFTTPYMIRLSVPAYNWASKRIPSKWMGLLEHYSIHSHTTVNQENNWRKFLKAVFRMMLVYCIVTVATIAICTQFITPFLLAWLPRQWGDLVGMVITILAISPFLRAIMVKKNHSVEFQALWRDNRFNRAPLVSIILLRIVLAVCFVMYVISAYYHASAALAGGAAIVLVLLMIYSRWLKKHSIVMERTFMQNLNLRDRYEEYRGEKQPEYVGHLLSHDLHLSDFDIPADCAWAGQTLKELNMGRVYGVHVASILRGSRRINIPGGDERIYPNDRLQVIGTDEQLATLGKAMSRLEEETKDKEQQNWEHQEMRLKQFIIDADSPFLDKSIRHSGIRNQYNCLIVGIEKADGTLMSPDADEVLHQGEVIWVVGEEKDVAHLLDKTKEKANEP
ncbi:cation:proton antiporter [Bacteroides sp. Marseille-P3684]|uniref:cation:proton antiporter domain-containing protein n=1 Tax=Bacteroides sp. Marseille-P3684 TaxID=2086579 RepID=UPI000D0AF599|nr:cation:proton antiporter [Bacteroides sp. Marseille-P3684]